MAEQEIVLEGELSKPEPKKKKKWPRWVEITVDITMVTLVAMSLFVATNIVFLRTNYNSSFYVNGMSMYPTLNSNCLGSNGNKLNCKSGSEHRSGYQAEYGYAKTDNLGDWKNDLHRLDIVITYYADDYQKNSDGSFKRDSSGALMLQNDRKSKIKRIIGLPGETIKFQPCSEDDPDGMYNRVWGKTTITHVDGTTELLKPLYNLSDYLVDGVTDYAFPGSASYGTVTLKENEYYVMGDNRGYSSDSRQKGPVTLEMILGKAYLIVGKKTVENVGEEKVPIWHIFTPWTYRRIG